MPYSVRMNMEPLAQYGLEQSPGESLWRFEAREMRKDVRVCFLGVANPTWARGCEDGFLRSGWQ